MPRRPQAEQDGGERRDEESENENGQIERNFLEARDVVRSQGDERVPHPKRDEHSQHSAQQRNDKTFDQKLPNDLDTTRSDRGANSKLSRARGAACSKQIRQICASYEENQSNRADKKREIRAIFADQIFEQRHDDNANLCIRRRINFFQPRRDCFHLGPRLLDRHAGLEPAPDKHHRMMRTIHPRRVVASSRQGEPRVGVLRRSHLRRHHTDNGEVRIVKINRATDHIRIAIKGTLPQSVTDHDHRRAADFVFVFAKHAPEFRRQTNDVKEIFRDRGAGNALRFAARNAAEVARLFMRAGEILENRVVVLPVEIIRQRDRKILTWPGRFVQHHDAICFRIW